MKHLTVNAARALPLAWFEAAPAGFWDRVEIGAADECWPWKMSLNSSGYGNYREDGQPALAHLVAFRAAHGEMPAGRECGHTCNRTDCINPAHHKPVTTLENAAERGLRRRGKPQKVLTEIIVRTARQLRRLGMKIKDIAAQFGLLAKTVGNAIAGRTWAWVTDEPATA